MKKSGNTILITGGASGIGLALAKRFAEYGNTVLICGRREYRLEEAKAEIPGLAYKVCDISSEEDRKALFDWAVTEYPALNILINNGAYQNDYSLVKGIDALAGAAEEINVNLTAPIMMNALFTEHLRNVKDAAIINVTSILGFMPLASIPIYCASKAGFHTYTIVQRKQYADAGIDIKIFEAPPPRVETELNAAGRAVADPALLGPPGLDPMDYADFVIAGFENDELDIFYGPVGQDARFKPRNDVELRRLSPGGYK